jgi:SAM-dependent methyltransferase
MTRPPDDYIVRNAREYMIGVDEYAAYNADRSVIASYLEALCERTPEGSRVLDLGCGAGWETQALHDRGYEAVGFDLSRAMCEFARREHPADAHVVGDMTSLPFAEDSFAGVWACASMLHIAREHLPGVLSEVARVLTPGGAFVASVQVGDSQRFVPRKSAPGHELFYGYVTPEEWRSTVERAGFVIDDLVAQVTDQEQAHLNEGSRGWATVIARLST